MKKFLIVFALLLALFVAIPAAASEPVSSLPAETTSLPEMVTTVPDTTTSATQEEPPEGSESAISELSDILKDWIPEILSAVSLVLAAAVAYLFKKGLLPTVTKFLSSTADLLKKSHSKVSEEVSSIAEILSKQAKMLENLESRLVAREDKLYSEAELISEALTDMSDTLTDIFEHTNLPADTKAMVTAKHREHTEKIRMILSRIAGEANET